MSHTLTRQTLYENVWSEPLKKLASKYGVSDVALAKACRKAGIPVPERGYWARKKAGKPVIQPKLPPRFPGANEIIQIGKRTWDPDWQSKLLNEPLPQPPEFVEDIASVRERVTRMVGKVSYPHTMNNTHPLIAALLAHDAERHKHLEKYPYAWDKPRHDTPSEKRRLRLLNAIFLAAQKTGCRPHLPTSQYDHEIRQASIDVGSQEVRFTLQEIPTRTRNKPASRKKIRFRLLIDPPHHDHTERYAWEDSDASTLEGSLTAIVIELLMYGEAQYRNREESQHAWLVSTKHRLEEEIRQRALEAQRREVEIEQQRAQARVERLLSEASALNQAETIRRYVTTVRERINEISLDRHIIDSWAIWALNQADKLDPVLSFSCNLPDADDFQPETFSTQ